jgi:hypothetical protein
MESISSFKRADQARRCTRATAICWILAPSLLAAQGPTSAASSGRSRPAIHKRGSEFEATITFKFDIPNLVTDHQFAGQTNSFHVQYTYWRILEGAEFDPVGHPVSAKTYPYFQVIRKDMIEFIKWYLPKDDFYEVFTRRIAEHVMSRYPQIARLELSVDIPAYADVPIPRSVSLILSRR